MDDDVEITDVDDGQVLVEKTSLKNQDLSSLSDTVGELLSQYGWGLLLLTVLLYLLLQLIQRRRATHSRSQPLTTQDAALVASRQEALEASRRRMQEELDAKAVLFKEKQRQQEEEKRRQKIESWESMKQGKSYRGPAPQVTEEAGSSTSTTVLKSKTGKKPLRSTDYSPLAGQGGGSCSFRPGRRGPSSGG